jgi:uncharacterized protein (TIGR03086 family)
MHDLLGLHAKAAEEFGHRVHAIRPDQWHAPTPCTDWEVRDLVNHLVYEQLWVLPLLDGATVQEVGDRFDGDQLGDDPVRTWDAAIGAARAALAAPGVLDRTVHLSFGDVPGRDYVKQLTTDLTVHGWDLARGIGADDGIDPELTGAVYEWTVPQLGLLGASGLFAPPVPVPDDADEQTRMIALFGRDPSGSGTRA